MKRIMIYILVFLIGYYVFSIFVGQSKTVGNQSSQKTWVYLGGLLQDIDSNTQNLALLDSIGKKVGVRIVVIPSKFRCPQYNNQLCWPHENEQEVQKTYAYIKSFLNIKCIEGFIGFSNGAFFLSELIQVLPINKHVVLVGGGGWLKEFGVANVKKIQSITVVIGKQDTYHYESSMRFVKQLKEQGIGVQFIEHNGGHAILPKTISDALSNIS